MKYGTLWLLSLRWLRWVGDQVNQLDYAKRVREWFGHYIQGEPAPKWITEGQTALDRDSVLRVQK